MEAIAKCLFALGKLSELMRRQAAQGYTEPSNLRGSHHDDTGQNLPYLAGSFPRQPSSLLRRASCFWSGAVETTHENFLFERTALADVDFWNHHTRNDVRKRSRRSSGRHGRAGFHIGDYQLDKDHWSEGYVTV
jgi:hypothetical protein